MEGRESVGEAQLYILAGGASSLGWVGPAGTSNLRSLDARLLVEYTLGRDGRGPRRGIEKAVPQMTRYFVGRFAEQRQQVIHS